MNRSLYALNFITVGLLILITLGLVLMPRHNYAIIQSSIAQLEKKVAALETGFEKLNILAGMGEDGRAAVLGNLDGIYSTIKGLQSDETSFLENLSTIGIKLEELSKRVSAIEPVIGNGHGTIDPLVMPQSKSQGEAKQFERNLGLPPRSLAELDFEKFLETLSDKGLPPFKDNKHSALNEQNLLSVKNLYESFCSCIRLINHCEQLFTMQLVERATRAGDYTDDYQVAGDPNQVQALPG